MSNRYTGIAASADFPGRNPHDHALAHLAPAIKNGGVQFAQQPGRNAAGNATTA